jgi:hypothetical protein
MCRLTASWGSIGRLDTIDGFYSVVTEDIAVNMAEIMLKRGKTINQSIN